MVRRPLRIATTGQLEQSVREAGFEAYRVPLDDAGLDFHRPLTQRLADGAVLRPFLEKHDIDMLLDHNTETMTLVPVEGDKERFAMTAAVMGIPYVASYLDPVTSTMQRVPWADHWQLLESPDWIKWIFETAHGDELRKLGVPQVLMLPMAAANRPYDTSPPPEPDAGPVVAFMGHPASSWFHNNQSIGSRDLFAGLTAAAVRADMPDLAFHNIYFDLHDFATPPMPTEDFAARVRKSAEYFSQKFAYNAYLAVRQRDRFARFLKNKLGDLFELVGDHWEEYYGLPHTPRIWDMSVLHQRMRRVPICLNLMKGCLESGLNIRHFEITANGGFMLTYETPELHQCFKVGEECDVFRSEAELLEKIQYYLAHPQRRREIALAGQRRTLSEHLYSHRITRVVELLRDRGLLPHPPMDSEWQAEPVSHSTAAASVRD
ncbi:MAG: glycosyltransferase family 1 protein [Phycisphaerae bacterium]|nr:glycosyltransferase family 1 protein [Phycisphaerae bacterium]